MDSKNDIDGHDSFERKLDIPVAKITPDIFNDRLECYSLFKRSKPLIDFYESPTNGHFSITYSKRLEFDIKYNGRVLT